MKLNKLHFQTESHQQIEELSFNLLKSAGVFGVIPTPLDDIIKHIKCEKVNGLEPIKSRYISRLSSSAAEKLRSILEKVRAIADLREKAIYIPETTHHAKVTFATAHEIGHQSIPWHRVNNSGYSDTDETLAPDIQVLFEQEANQFASEIIFQGTTFRRRSRLFVPSFDAILTLHDEFGASVHSTIWRFVLDSQDCIAVLPYRETFIADEEETFKLRMSPIIPSTSFLNEFSEVSFPELIDSSSEWTRTFYDRQPRNGEMILLNDRKEKVAFEWESWTNRYSLFVLLSRKRDRFIPRKIIQLVR